VPDNCPPFSYKNSFENGKGKGKACLSGACLRKSTKFADIIYNLDLRSAVWI
jgi:hypothetical protein